MASVSGLAGCGVGSDGFMAGGTGSAGKTDDGDTVSGGTGTSDGVSFEHAASTREVTNSVASSLLGDDFMGKLHWMSK